MSKEENMKLWRAVEKTNPAHTKKVKFGRAITAIDPYRQIEAATEQFGPATQGWGWEVKKVHELEATKQIGVLIRLWVYNANQYIEQWGQAGLYIDNKNTKKDEDCFKKATTDGVTKCLSYLGFNSDIFFGLYDDNKYVAKMKEEFSEEEKPKKVKKTAMDQAIDAIKAAKTVEAVEALVWRFKSSIKLEYDEVLQMHVEAKLKALKGE